MRIKTFTICASVATLLLLCLLLIIVQHEKSLQADIVGKENHRYNALKLANELLQSSENLTRMARSYIVTGDAKYERYFLEILEIRDGKRPRPDNYSSAYWHLAGVGKGQAIFSGEQYSLRELVHLAKLNAKEQTLLRQSQGNSDDLVDLERKAFAAMKGMFDDGSGDYLIRRTPDRDFAIDLLYGEDYIKAKAKIMEPLEQFVTQRGSREQSEISLLQDELSRIILF